jgi:hypothetical protein
MGFISEIETAALLAVKTGTLANWRARGKGPPFTKPNDFTVVYPLDGVRAYLRDRTFTPAKLSTLARPALRRRAALS